VEQRSGDHPRGDDEDGADEEAEVIAAVEGRERTVAIVRLALVPAVIPLLGRATWWSRAGSTGCCLGSTWNAPPPRRRCRSSRRAGIRSRRVRSCVTRSVG
jgi:hypothetical protein